MIMKRFANRYYYSDIIPFEIIKVISGKTLLVREMRAELKEDAEKSLKGSFVAGGFAGHFDNSLQDWNISTDETKPTLKIRLHKNGYYYAANDNGHWFSLSDEPIKFYDYNF